MRKALVTESGSTKAWRHTNQTEGSCLRGNQHPEPAPGICCLQQPLLIKHNQETKRGFCSFTLWLNCCDVHLRQIHSCLETVWNYFVLPPVMVQAALIAFFLKLGFESLPQLTSTYTTFSRAQTENSSVFLNANYFNLLKVKTSKPFQHIMCMCRHKASVATSAPTK